LLMFCTVLPNSIVSRCMNNGEDYYCISPNDEENTLGKLSSENTTNLWVSTNAPKDSGFFSTRKIAALTSEISLSPRPGSRCHTALRYQ
jgi:hypothetical protein